MFLQAWQDVLVFLCGPLQWEAFVKHGMGFTQSAANEQVNYIRMSSFTKPCTSQCNRYLHKTKENVFCTDKKYQQNVHLMSMLNGLKLYAWLLHLLVIFLITYKCVIDIEIFKINVIKFISQTFYVFFISEESVKRGRAQFLLDNLENQRSSEENL